MENNKKKCILIVDDEAIIRLTAKDLLDMLGYKVLLAENSNNCLEIIKEEGDSIDLVILDVKMPLMNGKDCYLKLKKIQPNLKIIFSSGILSEDEEKLLNDENVVGFIKKPYTIEEMREKLETTFNSI